MEMGKKGLGDGGAGGGGEGDGGGVFMVDFD